MAKRKRTKKKKLSEIERVNMDMLDFLEAFCENDVIEDIGEMSYKEVKAFEESYRLAIKLTKDSLVHMNKVSKILCEVLSDLEDWDE